MREVSNGQSRFRDAEIAEPARGDDRLAVKPPVGSLRDPTGRGLAPGPPGDLSKMKTAA